MDMEYSVEELGDDFYKLKDSKNLTADLTEALNGAEGRKNIESYDCNVIESSMMTANRHHGING
jgi:hypothetical protein